MTEEEYAQLNQKYGMEDDFSGEEQTINSQEVGTAGGIARAVGQGLSLGFGDEIEAFAKSGFTDKSYDEELATVREQLAQFKEQNPVAAYGGEIAGSIIPSFTPLGALGKVGQAVSKMGSTGRAATSGAVQGGIYGAGAAEGDLKDRATGGAVGFGVGGFGGSVIGSFLPKTSQAAQELVDMGVPVTIGQAFKGQGATGKLISGMEESMTSYPGIGPSVAEGRLRGLAEFNKLAMLEAVEPALTKAELQVAKKQIQNLNGQEAFSEITDIVSQKYNKLTEDFVLPESSINSLQNKFSNILNMEYKDILNKENAKTINAIFQKQLNKQTKNKNGKLVLEGQNLKKFEASLKTKAKEFKKKGGMDSEIGDVFEEMHSILKDEINLSNPGNNLAGINKAWAGIATIKLAVNKANKNKGIFTATQFLDSIKQADPTKGSTYNAKGKALMQSFADKGNEVLANVTPDSGTASRLVGGENIRSPKRLGQGILGALAGEITYNPLAQRLLRNTIDKSGRVLNTAVPYTSKSASGLLSSIKDQSEEERLNEEEYMRSLL